MKAKKTDTPRRKKISKENHNRLDFKKGIQAICMDMRNVAFFDVPEALIKYLKYTKKSIDAY